VESVFSYRNPFLRKAASIDNIVKYIFGVRRQSRSCKFTEILFWNNDPTEGNRPDPQLDFSPTPFSDDPTNLGNAFTRRGIVKHFWNLPGSEGQPSGPASPNAETELIPSGTLRPTAASWEAEPVETESPVGLDRLASYR
jgi:hypothetical protein